MTTARFEPLEPLTAKLVLALRHHLDMLARDLDISGSEMAKAAAGFSLTSSFHPFASLLLARNDIPMCLYIPRCLLPRSVLLSEFLPPSSRFFDRQRLGPWYAVLTTIRSDVKIVLARSSERMQQLWPGDGNTWRRQYIVEPCQT